MINTSKYIQTEAERKNKKKGLSILGTILVIGIIIIVLSYVGFDIKKAVESDQSKKNFGYVKAVIVTVWERYLARPATYLYNDIWLDLIWHPTIDNLKKMRDGGETNIQEGAPKVLEINIPKYNP